MQRYKLLSNIQSLNKRHTSQWFARLLAGICSVSLFLAQGLTVCAANEKELNIAAHQAMAVDSNEVENWPMGPTVSAESAILMEADTGAILYAKNIHKQQYPASTTKILTTLIASERCTMDEIVTFSHDAVFDIDRGSNHIAIDVGEKLTMEECLNAILIRSANEVSLAVAEHISGGPWEDFAAIMNERARELGCLNSNFVNPNGLPNEEHVTTAYDLAMIGRAFFANETLCKMTLTPMLRIHPSEYQPDDITEVNQMELISTGKYAYEYLVGCKTGYTNAARSSLVSCAEKNGMKLICVVLRDESPYQYEDTLALFDYGFNNFDKINVSEAETKYNIDTTDSFYSENNIFGDSKPILSLNQDACIILPKTLTFADTISTISYDTPNENQAALITYTYQDVILGSVSVDLAVSQENAYTFDSITGEAESVNETTEEQEGSPSFIFVNIVKVILMIVGIVAIIFIIIASIYFKKNYQFPQKNTRRAWLRNQRRKFSLRNFISSKVNNKLSTGSSFQAQRKKQIREAKRRRKPKRPNRFRDYDF